MDKKIVRITQKEIVIIETRPVIIRTEPSYYDDIALAAFIVRQLVSIASSIVYIKETMKPKPFKIKPGSVRIIRPGQVRIIK